MATAIGHPAQSQFVEEKPTNGLKGLKHWRHDIVAGLLVSLVSLPLSLGIAIASGAPPVCGLISAIIAGLVMPLLGGTYVTISGPAAGLAPALLASMALLGQGNLENGYPLLLGVICITGAVQIVLSFFKAARYSALFPTAVVEGMLASIGLLIIAKQLPNFIGHPFHAHEFFGIVFETPSELMLMNPRVFLLAGACLSLLFVLSASKSRLLKLLPPPLIVVTFGAVFGWFLGLEDAFLIHVPENLFEHGLVMPNFSGLLTDQTLWWAVASTVLVLTMIDGVESLATAAAVDRIDPFHRKSDPDRTLLAMGVSNICSSLAGGLTIIPGGVKSKVCIMAGGRTLWANFYNALFLLLYLFAATRLINLIPLGALAAVLIHTGYKMCEPHLWRHMAHVGREQLAVFTVTIVATLCTDLLWGIGIGMLAKLILHVSFTWPAKQNLSEEPVRLGQGLFDTLRCVATLFRNPVSQREMRGLAYNLYCDKPLVCFNWQFLSQELANTPAEAQALFVHITPDVRLVDHTTLDNLIAFGREFRGSGRGPMEIVGLEQMWSKSEHASSLHRAANAEGVPSRFEGLKQRFIELLSDRSRIRPVIDEINDDQKADLAKMGLAITAQPTRDTRAELGQRSLVNVSRGPRDTQLELERMSLTPPDAVQPLAASTASPDVNSPPRNGYC